MRRLLGLAIAACFALSTPAMAKVHRHHGHHHMASHHTHRDANANLACRNSTVQRQTAYGINICVDPVYADKFVNFFSALHARGVNVTDIVCQAYGHVRGSNHEGGGACDVNQTGKNRTIPAMYHAGDLIRAAGLYDGCSFRDCGHVEAMRGLGHYGFTRTYAARSHRTRVAQNTPRYSGGDYMSRFGAGI